MAQIYIVQGGDTLLSIAESTYGDRALAQALADYNGVRDASRIAAGQCLQVPSRRELLGKPGAGPAEGNTLPPAGLRQICETFGDIYSYVQAEGFDAPRWEQDYIVAAALPFPMRLSWDNTRTVTRFRCHKRMASIFAAVFETVMSRGLQDKLVSFAGCYQQRAQRNSSKLSTHTWGIAMDLNSESNGLGTRGDMDPRIVSAFREAGFKWGGDWPGKHKDPMHFQFCTGY